MQLLHVTSCWLPAKSATSVALKLATSIALEVSYRCISVALKSAMSVALKVSNIGSTQIGYVSHTQSYLHWLHSSWLRQFHPKLAASVALKVNWHSNQLCWWDATRMDRDLWLICCQSQEQKCVCVCILFRLLYLQVRRSMYHLLIGWSQPLQLLHVTSRL